MSVVFPAFVTLLTFVAMEGVAWLAHKCFDGPLEESVPEAAANGSALL